MKHAQQYYLRMMDNAIRLFNQYPNMPSQQNQIKSSTSRLNLGPEQKPTDVRGKHSGMITGYESFKNILVEYEKAKDNIALKMQYAREMVRFISEYQQPFSVKASASYRAEKEDGKMIFYRELKKIFNAQELCLCLESDLQEQCDENETLIKENLNLDARLNELTSHNQALALQVTKFQDLEAKVKELTETITGLEAKLKSTEKKKNDLTTELAKTIAYQEGQAAIMAQLGVAPADAAPRFSMGGPVNRSYLPNVSVVQQSSPTIDEKVATSNVQNSPEIEEEMKSFFNCLQGLRGNIPETKERFNVIKQLLQFGCEIEARTPDDGRGKKLFNDHDQENIIIAGGMIVDLILETKSIAEIIDTTKYSQAGESLKALLNSIKKQSESSQIMNQGNNYSVNMLTLHKLKEMIKQFYANDKSKFILPIFSKLKLSSNIISYSSKGVTHNAPDSYHTKMVAIFNHFQDALTTSSRRDSTMSTASRFGSKNSASAFAKDLLDALSAAGNSMQQTSQASSQVVAVAPGTFFGGRHATADHARFSNVSTVSVIRRPK